MRHRPRCSCLALPDGLSSPGACRSQAFIWTAGHLDRGEEEMTRKILLPPAPAGFTDSAYPSLDGVERQSGKGGGGGEVGQRVASRELEAREMKRAGSLYDKCHELFTAYPLAVQPV